MSDDCYAARWLRGLRISAVALAGLSFLVPPASAQTPGSVTGEKVTVYPDAADPCPIPMVLAESAFAITCRSGTAELLERLRRPDACGKEAKHRPGDACAVLIYVIDDYENAKKYRLPPTWTVRIGKVSRSEKVEEAAITLRRNAGAEEQLGPQQVYELLLPIRVAERIAEYKTPGGNTIGGGSPPKRAAQSVSFLDKDIRYFPALVVGRGRASEVMSEEAVKNHFESRCLFYEFTC
jgi:hypothetical protein